MDIVVTVPMNFTHFASPGKKGLAAWIGEGDPAGDEWSGTLWGFTVSGGKPDIKLGERVYIVCEYRVRGYAPLVKLIQLGNRYWELGRGGGAQAVTIDRRVVGFRGWRYRWWELEEEREFPDWKGPFKPITQNLF